MLPTRIDQSKFSPRLKNNLTKISKLINKSLALKDRKRILADKNLILAILEVVSNLAELKIKTAQQAQRIFCKRNQSLREKRKLLSKNYRLLKSLLQKFLIQIDKQ